MGAFFLNEVDLTDFCLPFGSGSGGCSAIVPHRRVIVCEGRRIQGTGDGRRKDVQERSTEACERRRGTIQHRAADSNGPIHAKRPHSELFAKFRSSLRQTFLILRHPVY